MLLTPVTFDAYYPPRFSHECFEKQPYTHKFSLKKERSDVIIVLMMKYECAYLLRQG